MKLVECVPNFSEGRDKTIIEAIATAISSADGVALLDVDPGADTNRTVYTFIGEPEAVAEGAFRGIAKAAELIDMSKHKGAHSRIGACDVCPFVPVRGVDMKECIQLARGLGERVAEELKIPIYLYEEAATRPARRNLAEIRKGEYEGLAEKLKNPKWKPDFGSALFNKRSGATAMGAREFLIAYNFNLNTRDHKIAHEIALEIREAGRAKRDAKGKIIRNKNGKTKKKPGKFKHVKAVGWYMQDFKCAQISINLTNYKKTKLADVFEEVGRQARQRGVICTGSELVGLIPKDCLLEASRHFLAKAEKSAGLPEPELIRLAIQSLGLNELYPFDPDKKIIDYRIRDPRPLANLSLIDFADELSTDSPAPGGGSVAALCGALAASLACMVGQLTAYKKEYRKVSTSMKELSVLAQQHKDDLMRAVDDDTAAFNEVMAAFRLPKKTAALKANRQRAIQQAMRQACLVPMNVLRSVGFVVELAEQAVLKGNRNSLSDAGVAGLCARAAAEGAYYNVQINLADIKDKTFVKSFRVESDKLYRAVVKKTDQLSKHVKAELSKALNP
ncbi:MAG: glutamate formimidoyltransferase [Deltaproteobacteria bacterium]|nr:glutamate formimidoyltransferase [Deltaproteobacteria bacterium]